MHGHGTLHVAVPRMVGGGVPLVLVGRAATLILRSRSAAEKLQSRKPLDTESTSNLLMLSGINLGKVEVLLGEDGGGCSVFRGKLLAVAARIKG